MDIIIYFGTLLTGFGLNIFWKHRYERVDILARFYLWIVLLSAVSTWIYYFAGIKNETALQVMSHALKWLGAITHLSLGFLLGWLAMGIKRLSTSDAVFPATLNITLWALSISVGNSFILATVGKSVNMAIMISFFKQSGYAVWFLYFIMAAETAGAIGILSHFRLKMGIPAAAGLVLIMLGAIYTHWHNGDPFSDSYAAVSQLISESLLLFLYNLERKTEILIIQNHPVTPGFVESDRG
jgi:putative oxidoreductase